MTNDPNWKLPEVPSFRLESPDVASGAELPRWARSSEMDGGDRSPGLRWSRVPEGTKSFALTVYDPDAPTGSGFWHWAVYDLPARLTELAADAGNPDANLLPEGAITLPNELRLEKYLGASPPAGHGPHRYYFTLTALDIDHLELDAGSTPAVLGFNFLGHALGRAQFYATSETQ